MRAQCKLSLFPREVNQWEEHNTWSAGQQLRCSPDEQPSDTKGSRLGLSVTISSGVTDKFLDDCNSRNDRFCCEPRPCSSVIDRCNACESRFAAATHVFEGTVLQNTLGALTVICFANEVRGKLTL